MVEFPPAATFVLHEPDARNANRIFQALRLFREYCPFVIGGFVFDSATVSGFFGCVRSIATRISQFKSASLRRPRRHSSRAQSSSIIVKLFHGAIFEPAHPSHWCWRNSSHDEPLARSKADLFRDLTLSYRDKRTAIFAAVLAHARDVVIRLSQARNQGIDSNRRSRQTTAQ